MSDEILEKPLLLFHNDLDARRELIEGRLLLLDGQTNRIIDTFIATSGCPGYQNVNQTALKGKGSIPLPSKVGIPHYNVTTRPLNLPTKGVEGDFFCITPYLVTIDGVQRGDFGVHRDANVPGSAGCVVLRTPVGWEAFRDWMGRFNAHGRTQVPLLVSYN